MAGAVVLAASVAWVGCDRDGARTYRAPKENAAPAASAAAMPPAGGPVPAIGTVPEVLAPRVTWKLPAGWQELPPSQMRVGHFMIRGENGQQAVATIIPLGGTGGGNLSNVNRWRSQVSLAAITDEEANKLAEPVEIAGAKGALYDFLGQLPEDQKKARLMSAVLYRDGTAWFFKMVGDDALVVAQKPAFVSFLKTIEFGAAPAEGASIPPMAQAPAVVPAAPAAPAAAVAGSAHPGWTVPSAWKEVAAGPMQVAKFSAAEGKADVTVAVLAGEAGGKPANINRWRGQLGLPPLDEAALEKSLEPLVVAGATTYLVDFKNDSTGRRMAAAGVTVGGQTWFYKLTGDNAAVTAQKEAFLKFIRDMKHGS